MKSTRSRLLVIAILVLGMVGFNSARPIYAAVTACPADESALSSDIGSAGNLGTVVFDCAAATTIHFTSTITISQGVTLNGSSSQPVTLDGDGSVRLFSVSSGTTFDVTGLTLSHGSAAGYGGAINSSGTVHITDDTLSDDSASSGGGAIYNNSGTLTIDNSTLTHDSARQNGGAIFNNVGTVYVANSTLAHNTATYGGAIFGNTSGTVHFSNSTVADNTSTSYAIYNAATLTIATTILARNSGGGCAGAAVTDEGYNLTEDVQNCGMNNATDLTGISPDSKALEKNGGPTETMALDANSSAVDAIPASSGRCPATDQRGVTRLDDSETACDIGAYEHVDHLRIDVSVSTGAYSVYIDGATMEPGSSVDWRAKTPHGDEAGTVVVPSSGTVHALVFSHSCASEHITVDASGREVTASGVNDVTAHYEGDPC